MEIQVVIVRCKQDVFSQNAEAALLRALDLINRGDVGNISLTVQSFDLREISHSSVAVIVRKAKVQILIVTHTFIDELKHSSTKNFCQMFLNRVLNSKDVICILMGINAQQILRDYTKLFPHFLDWNVLELRLHKKLDQTFSTTFQAYVISSYNARTKHNESKIPNLPTAFRSTEGQLAENRNGDKALLSSITTRSDDGTETITVKLNEPVCPSDVLRIELRKGDDTYSTTVQIPDNLSPSSSLRSIVKIEAPFQVTPLSLSNEGDIIDQMIQKFPGYKQYMDDHMSEAIEKMYRLGATIENLPLLQEFLEGRGDLFPTVLHFAAYYGLKETAVSLLANEDGLRSIAMSNRSHETPLEIAVRRGNDSDIIQIFTQYEGVVDTWDAIKGVTSWNNTVNGTVTPEDTETTTLLENDPTITEDNDDTFENTINSDTDDSSPTEYQNVEVVLPDLPDRRYPPEPMSAYSVPSPHARPVFGANYDSPPPHSLTRTAPILTRMQGELPLTGNYIDIPRGNRNPKGDTLSHISRSPVRVNLDSSSDDDADFNIRRNSKPIPYNRPVPSLPSAEVDQACGYNQPVPELPSPTPDAMETRTADLDMDSGDKELLEIIKEAVTKGLSWEAIAYKVALWQQSPARQASDERRELALEQMRKQYREMQNKLKRDTKESGLLNRFVEGIRKAKKKISNAGIRSSGESSMSPDDRIPTPPTISSKFQYPTSMNYVHVSPRSKSPSLVNVLEEQETASPSRCRKRGLALDMEPTTNQDNETRNVDDQSKRPEIGDYLMICRESAEDQAVFADQVVDTSESLPVSPPKTLSPLKPMNVGPEPPPRPPRRPPKTSIKKPHPLPPHESDEKEKSIPPKPARRNLPENVHYINYDDRNKAN